MSQVTQAIAAEGAITDSDFPTNGLMTRIAEGSYTSRTIVGTSQEIQVANGDGVSGNPTLSIPSTLNLSSKTMKVPNSAGFSASTVGELGIDTNVPDLTGLVKYNDGSEELGVIAMPIAQFTTPTDGYVVSYNATNDEFELAASSDTLGDLTPTKGNIAVGNGSSWTVLAVGADSTTLTADSAEATGLKWAAGGGSSQFLSGYDILPLQNGFEIFTHCVSDTARTEFSPGISNGEVNADTDYSGSSGTHPGQWRFRLGNSATARAEVYCNDQPTPDFLLGSGEWVIEGLIILDELSTATDEYKVVLGLQENRYSSTVGDGVYFEYDRTNSTNWVGVTDDGTRNEVVGSAVSSATWHKLKIVVNAAASSVEFFVDGSSIGSTSSNIPTSTLLRFSCGVYNSASSLAQNILYSDYFYIRNELTTSI